MQLTVWVLVVVATRDRMRGAVGSVTSTSITSLDVPMWSGSLGAASTRSTPTRTKRLVTPSTFFSP